MKAFILCFAFSWMLFGSKYPLARTKSLKQSTRFQYTPLHRSPPMRAFGILYLETYLKMLTVVWNKYSLATHHHDSETPRTKKPVRYTF